jgi:hypothetical protein
MAKTTESYEQLRGLTIEQQNAIDLLVTGATDIETASAVGVNRVTVRAGLGGTGCSGCVCSVHKTVSCIVAPSCSALKESFARRIARGE